MIYTFTAIFLFIASLYAWRYQAIPSYNSENAFSSYLQDKKIIFLVCLFCLVLTLHDGLRWEIGTDWDSYLDAFIYGDDEHIDNGYKIFMSLFKGISDDYTFFLLSFAAIEYFIIGHFLLKDSCNPLMSLTIFYCSLLGMLGCNRQILATVICIFSLYFIHKRNLFCFLFLIGIAFTIHKTAITFIPAYFIYNVQYKNITIIITAIIAFIIGLTHIINHLPLLEYLTIFDSMTKVTSFSIYVDDAFASTSIIGSLKRILFIFLGLYTRQFINSKVFDYYFLLYIIGCCIFLIFNGSIVQLFAGRGALYYNIFECVVMPTIIMNIQLKGINNKIIWATLFCVYFYLMWRDINSYYVLLDGIDIFNPYKCVLFQ